MLQEGTIKSEERAQAINGVALSPIREELERVLNSRAFVHSHRIRRFLQFVVEECLEGRQHRLKEYLIGLEVFNRVESFDPRVDSIVRVEARRLRAKLEEYYESEGRDSLVRIELRKGSYIPMFGQRTAGPSSEGRGRFLPRNSIAFLRFDAPEGFKERLFDLRRRLAHVLVNEGHCRVFTEYDEKSGNGSAAGAAQPEYLLRGTLENTDGEPKILVQLEQAVDGSLVWSGFGSAENIEGLGRDLSRAVAISRAAEGGRLRRRHGEDGSSDPYLQGRYLWKRATPDSVRSSTALFQQAVERDRSYGAAWASLAESLIVSSLFGMVAPAEANAKMKEAAQRALELSPGLPEAHVAGGITDAGIDHDWTSGESKLLQAVRFDGRHPSVHIAYALLLTCRDMCTAAQVEIDRALELDPASLAGNFALGWFSGVCGRYDEAAGRHAFICGLAPDFPLAYLGLGWAYLGRGLYADALAHFTNAANLLKCRAFMAGCLGYCHARQGNREEALRILEELLHPPAGQYAPRVSIAAVYAGLGEADRAFEYLNKSCDEGELALAPYLLNPEFNELRADSRFAELQTKLGLIGQGEQLSTETADLPLRKQN